MQISNLQKDVSTFGNKAEHSYVKKKHKNLKSKVLTLQKYIDENSQKWNKPAKAPEISGIDDKFKDFNNKIQSKLNDLQDQISRRVIN